ncbi:hypothetical protein ACFU5O_07135 [Streptomyces sp. NPDC057445]|uniref:hypothetical protein n=1 Tax=Streptomyces sp. NPDC057445 TaxID=3346136 RepID=UPI0036BBC651
MAVGAVVAGAVLMPRLGRGALHLGALVTAVGVGVLTLHGAGADVDGRQLSPGLLVTGVGMGLVLSPFFDFALASVDEQETGSASGVLNANQQLGATVGVAVLGTLFFALVGAQVGTASNSVLPQLRQDVVSAGAPAASSDALADRIEACTKAMVEQTDQQARPAACRTLMETAGRGATHASRPDAYRTAVAKAERRTQVLVDDVILAAVGEARRIAARVTDAPSHRWDVSSRGCDRPGPQQRPAYSPIAPASSPTAAPSQGTPATTIARTRRGPLPHL